MKLKTYHSESVEAAVRLAGVELGDDAIFLGSREKPRGQGGDGYEVTFAVMQTPAAGAEEETESPVGAGSRSPDTSAPARRMAAQNMPVQPMAARHADAADTVRTARAPSTAAAATAPQTSASQTRLSTSSGTNKRIERPHWKRYVPEDLEANFKRTPPQDGISIGRRDQARGPAVSGSPAAAADSAPPPAVADVPAQAALDSRAATAFQPTGPTRGCPEFR